MPKNPNRVPVKRSSGSRAAALTLAVMASTAWTGSARANEWAAANSLSTLNGQNGTRFDGTVAGDKLGNQVAVVLQRKKTAQEGKQGEDIADVFWAYFGSGAGWILAWYADDPDETAAIRKIPI